MGRGSRAEGEDDVVRRRFLEPTQTPSFALPPLRSQSRKNSGRSRAPEPLPSTWGVAGRKEGDQGSSVEKKGK